MTNVARKKFRHLLFLKMQINLNRKIREIQFQKGNGSLKEQQSTAKINSRKEARRAM